MTYNMEIQIYGRPVLSQKAEPVETITPELLEILDEMTEIMKKSRGVGLAAPQVGISERFFIMNPSNKIVKVINPEIISYGNSFSEMEEGCLSIPGIYKKVRRPRRISVQYTNEHGDIVKEELKDYPARVFQHEYDHLDGILFVDRLTPVSKKIIAKKLDELKGTEK